MFIFLTEWVNYQHCTKWCIICFYSSFHNHWH